MNEARNAERWIRVASGLILMVLGITLPIPFWVEEVAETIGLLAAITGAVGYCPPEAYAWAEKTQAGVST